MVSPQVWYGLAVIAGSLLGPILFTIWVRNQERYEPEPWPSVAVAFAWGGTGAVVLAVVLSLLLTLGDTLRPVGVSSALVSAVVVAPIVEEVTKGLGLRWVPDPEFEVEDGLVYGAAVGLGFSATENLVYGVSAYLEGGIEPLVWTIGVRTFTSSLLHASASAILGYAVWRRRVGVGGLAGIALFYAAAVGLHAAFNVAAGLQLWVTFLLGLAIATVGFGWVRRRVRELDRSP